jgi:MoaA/NifB/PqqE/SkfB family radical SAM enzyme
MRSGLLPVRVVHVHPTRTCNLACAHCYSTSSPSERGALGVDVLAEALAHLRSEGYENLSISGGEPLVYRGLDDLAARAMDCGYRVHLITNGVLLSEQRLRTLRPHVEFVGVSLDGCEETHNAVRGRADAYAKAMRALRVLADSGVPFGIVFGVSRRSLGDVPWAFERARELGARLLHLRPLAPEGRAERMDETWTLSHEDCTRLVVLTEVLAGFGSDGPHVQVDLVAADDLAHARDQFELLRESPNVAQLSDAVNPLVIDEQGRCLPFVYGMDPGFEVARIPSADGAAVYRPIPKRLGRIADLLRVAFREEELPGGAYLDWFAHLARLSRRFDQLGVPATSGSERRE